MTVGLAVGPEAMGSEASDLDTLAFFSGGFWDFRVSLMPQPRIPDA